MRHTCQQQNACRKELPAVVQVLDIREKELGPDHVDVAASLNNIAVLLKTSGQFEEAEEMYNRSIAIKENALGPNHPQVLLLPVLLAYLQSLSEGAWLACATVSAVLQQRHYAQQKKTARMLLVWKSMLHTWLHMLRRLVHCKTHVYRKMFVPHHIITALSCPPHPPCFLPHPIHSTKLSVNWLGLYAGGIVPEQSSGAATEDE